MPDPQARYTELGAFLRDRRARVSPQEAGLPPGSRRRTQGLRREEVAMLCGLSVTWYTWIEQGREISVSPQALARLAKVLRLTQAERAYLFDLAGKRDPDAPVAATDIAPLEEGLRAVVAAIATPAYVLDVTTTALVWNQAAASLFVGWLDAGEGRDRNLLRFMFLNPRSRDLIPDHDSRARRILAEFRADYGHLLEDRRLTELIEALRRESALFARLWDDQGVTLREGGIRCFAHPREGRICYRQVSFLLASRPELKLVVMARES